MKYNIQSEEEKVIKVIRNLFRLKEEQNDTAIKEKRNLFRIKKEIKEIKGTVLSTSFFSIKKKKKIIINQ